MVLNSITLQGRCISTNSLKMQKMKEYGDNMPTVHLCQFVLRMAVEQRRSWPCSQSNIIIKVTNLYNMMCNLSECN